MQYSGSREFLAVEGTFSPLTFLLSLLRFLHVCLESGEETLSPPVLYGEVKNPGPGEVKNPGPSEVNNPGLVRLKFMFW